MKTVALVSFLFLLGCGDPGDHQLIQSLDSGSGTETGVSPNAVDQCATFCSEDCWMLCRSYSGVDWCDRQDPDTCFCQCNW